VPVTPGQWRLFEAFFLAEKVAECDRSVLARILWRDAGGKGIGRGEYPRTLREKSPEGWGIIRQAYHVPEKAAAAVLELNYRWDADGQVHFGGTSFGETQAPPPRPVRLATVFHRPKGSTPQANREAFARFVEKAAEKKADIVCLPEGITIIGTGRSYVDAAEPVPGPSSKVLGAAAKKHGMYVVAGILEREGEAVYNTAILLAPDGDVAGKYRKVCIPNEESDGGVTPGEALPVFDTRFGRIGIMICWDVHFPEPARALARKGAEVILMPIWGGNLTLAQARAIENQVYLVSSSYDMKTAVFDQAGAIIAEATEKDPVAVVEVDLNAQRLWPWLGDFKNRIPRELPAGKALRGKSE
jgi:predicted amidohydrolase